MYQLNDSNRKLKVFKASAGSGKTTTLALEYIKLALSQLPTDVSYLQKNSGSDFNTTSQSGEYYQKYRHILALTFTNKAAQEMKERILKYLEEMSALAEHTSDPFYVAILLKEIPRYVKIADSLGAEKAREILRLESRMLQKNILHNYSEYSVSTIDSFTNRLIRSFSFDLGLSANYQVELSSKILLRDSVDELLGRVNQSEEVLTAVLLAFSNQKINSEKSRKIGADLKSRAQSLLNDVAEEYLQYLRQINWTELLGLPKILDQQIEEYEATLEKMSKDFQNYCAQNGIEPNMIYQGGNGLFSYFNKLTNEKSKKPEVGKNIITPIFEGKWFASSTKQHIKDVVEPHIETLTAFFQNAEKYLEENFGPIKIKREISKGLYPYLVLIELEKILNQLKTEQEMVHISDFNKIIAREIANEPAPYIYERLGNKYHHFLLDEFQDTSVIQWHNLLPLVENSLAHLSDNLVVGDAKQSIYRFRGGDVEQFVNFPRLTHSTNDVHMLEREQVLIRSFHETHLQDNHRSGKQIVEFNNLLFGFIYNNNSYLPEKLKHVYSDVQQIPKNKTQISSHVEVHIIEKTTPEQGETKNEIYFLRVLSIINKCLKDGFELRDIVVLARKNKQLIELADWLFAREINVVSSESLYADSSPMVRFLISIIRFIYEPRELLYQVEIVRFLRENDKISGDASAMHKILTQINATDELKPLFKELGVEFNMNQLAHMEAYEALESLCRIFGLKTNHPLLHFFLEAALDFTQERHQNLYEFNSWWEEHFADYSLEMPDEWNAVKLMSFHKSKGLEFPVVINLFPQSFIRSSGNKTDELWLDPELKEFPQLKTFPFNINSLKDTPLKHHKEHHDELRTLDDLNLFYVAMTRAKNRLYLIVDQYIKPKNEKQENERPSVFPYHKLIHEFLSNQNLTQLDDFFVFGDPDYDLQFTNPADEKNSGSSLYMGENSNSSWRNEVKLALADQDSDEGESAEWGKKFHAFMAMTETTEDIDFSVNRMIHQGIVDEVEADLLKSKALMVFEHPLLSQYFEMSIKSYNEREMVTYDDGAPKIYRPDKILKLENETIVIDYKTGKPTHKNELQLMQYCQLTEKYSRKPSQGYLVYLHDNVDVIKIKQKTAP